MTEENGRNSEGKEIAQAGSELNAGLGRDRYSLVKMRIQNALGNGMDEQAWPPGEHWVDCACRLIRVARGNNRNRLRDLIYKYVDSSKLDAEDSEFISILTDPGQSDECPF